MPRKLKDYIKGLSFREISNSDVEISEEILLREGKMNFKDNLTKKKEIISAHYGGFTHLNYKVTGIDACKFDLNQSPIFYGEIKTNIFNRKLSLRSLYTEWNESSISKADSIKQIDEKMYLIHSYFSEGGEKLFMFKINSGKSGLGSILKDKIFFQEEEMKMGNRKRIKPIINTFDLLLKSSGEILVFGNKNIDILKSMDKTKEKIDFKKIESLIKILI